MAADAAAEAADGPAVVVPLMASLAAATPDPATRDVTAAAPCRAGAASVTTERAAAAGSGLLPQKAVRSDVPGMHREHDRCDAARRPVAAAGAVHANAGSHGVDAEGMGVAAAAVEGKAGEGVAVAAAAAAGRRWPSDGVFLDATDAKAPVCRTSMGTAGGWTSHDVGGHTASTPIDSNGGRRGRDKQPEAERAGGVEEHTVGVVVTPVGAAVPACDVPACTGRGPSAS